MKTPVSTPICLAAILLFFGSLARGQNPVESSRILRVLTFNIYHAANMDNSFDLDRVAGIIRFARPDLVALQEVDHKTNRSHKYDLMAELAGRTHLVPLFGRSMNFDGGEYGNGILSKFSFISSRVINLPNPEDKEPRTALEVLIKINEKDTVSFVATHLDHQDEAARLPQVEKINESVLKKNYPVLLAGDLNAVPGSETITTLEKDWESFYDNTEVEITFPDYKNPKKARKLDYIMGTPGNRWRMLETKVIKDDIASDHYALLMVVELLD